MIIHLIFPDESVELADYPGFRFMKGDVYRVREGENGYKLYSVKSCHHIDGKSGNIEQIVYLNGGAMICDQKGGLP